MITALEGGRKNGGGIVPGGVLEFFSDRHEYRLDGQTIPSVTQILKAAGLVDFGNAPQDRIEFAGRRGTLGHAACQYWDEDDLDLDSLDPQIIKYVVAWKNFRKDHGHLEIIETEQQHCGELGGLLFGATVDRVMQFGERRTIVDIKTASEWKPWYPVQLAGYACGLAGAGTVAERLSRYRRLIVHLKGDCTYRLYECTDARDGEIFAAALKGWWDSEPL